MPNIYPELWKPNAPIDVFFFDWDSTLTKIEGIDFLATLNDVAKQVHGITQRCMSKTGLNIADYAKRLDFIKPTSTQIGQLAEAYSTQLAPGARETLTLLQSIGKKIYILSAGIKSAIIPFAEALGIKAECVLAVDLYFNQEGTYDGFNELSELIQPYGKIKQIKKVLNSNERSILLGDGYSDCEAKSVVTRFVGYAGFNPKSWVQEHSDFYINHTSILPLLALSLTETEQVNLNREYKTYYEQGVADLENGLVLIKEYDNVHHTNS
jgi:phosphoserine phosphatase